MWGFTGISWSLQERAIRDVIFYKKFPMILA